MPPPAKQTEAKSKLPLLLAAVAVLGALVLWDRMSSDTAPEVTAARPAPRARDGTADDAARRARPDPLANLALDDLRDTVNRPLFERSRRPATPPAPPPVAPPPPPPPPRGPDPNALELVGIIAGDQQSVALLKRRASGREVRAQIGETIDGWTIADIEPQRVILRHGGTELALQLFQKPQR